MRVSRTNWSESKADILLRGLLWVYCIQQDDNHYEQSATCKQAFSFGCIMLGLLSLPVEAADPSILFHIHMNSTEQSATVINFCYEKSLLRKCFIYFF